MSDFVKIIVFTLFLSVLWVIPRFDLMIQWISSHIWYSSTIAISLVGLLLVFNWVKRKRAQRHILKEQRLNLEKSE
ncbi:hypothetical protein [Alkalihalobacillus deserti]|uniref:hypothetical protein n=1 Tax=Alkalihalobacillus deserti TaxID=2879466 RepID=UPI001D14B78C|nr:hypothetical protein [Alkalihalobacillus deserti]